MKKNIYGLVEGLYDTIKELRQEFETVGERLWTNITIRVEKFKFEVEFDYEDLKHSKYSNYDRHIFWSYKNLKMPLEKFERKYRRLILEYIEDKKSQNDITCVYSEPIYKRPVRSAVKYNQEVSLYLQPVEEHKKEYKNDYSNRYKKKNKKTVKKEYNRRKTPKEETYIEQIEKQKMAVKSQILNKI